MQDNHHSAHHNAPTARRTMGPLPWHASRSTIIVWQQYRLRDKKWVEADPLRDVAKFIIARAGEWFFQPVNGVTDP